MIDYSFLKQAFAAAGVVAKNAADKVEDGGSCNLDYLVVYNLGRFGEGSFEKHGISGWKVSLGRFAPRLSFPGQANKNTVGVEAARDYLNSLGIDCYVAYVLD